MRKVLFVATVVKTHIMVFHIPYLEWFKQNGYEVHVCAKNDYEDKSECVIPFCDKYIDVPFTRFPLAASNLSAYKQLKRIIDSNEYDIIHCHTPVGGVIARLAARKAREKGTKVIYTAHGFHFYKGAPLINWIAYYPIERWLAKYTDVLITINKEDYIRAKRSFKAEQIEYLPGVGIDTKKFEGGTVDKAVKRLELGISENTIAVLSVGELSKRKNHEVIIKALARLNNSDIMYLICGQGELESYLKNMGAELNVNVKFLGFRKDVEEIYSGVDIFAFPSYQEGLPVALMEAMAAGLPIVCSDIRGNTDLIRNDVGGYLVEADDIEGFAISIQKLLDSIELGNLMGVENIEKVKQFDEEFVKLEMEKLYRGINRD